MRCIRQIADIMLALVVLLQPNSSSLGADGYPLFSIVSGPETVFDYQTHKCDSTDIPDSPLRAFRRFDGNVVAMSTHYINRSSIGTSLASLHHECRVIFQGHHNEDPAVFDDRTWIAATWTPDGRSVTALGHNEFQADKFSSRCKFLTYQQCWYNSIVLLQSGDGGYTFSRSDRQDPTPLAASRFVSEVDQGAPRGYFDPSNIVSYGDSTYSLIAKRNIRGEVSGRCLFRSQWPDRLESWEYFDGETYIKSSDNPYKTTGARRPCEPVKGLQGTLGSIARLRESNLFVAFSLKEESKGGGEIVTSFSRDLLNWSAAEIVGRLPLFWSRTCIGGHRYNYASVVDDASIGRNFDNIGQDAWLYLVQADCNITMKRNLVRFRIRAN
jgi:hypothetical protein